MANEQRGSSGHEIKDYGKITMTKGGRVTVLGSPLRITKGKMDEDLYHEELFFSHTLELSKVVQEATKPLPDPGPTYLVCGSIFRAPGTTVLPSKHN